MIRPVVRGDIPDLKSVIGAADLFPPDLLDGMMASYLSDEGGREIWLTVAQDRPCAVAYCVPEPMTQGTWNLLLLAVHPDRQRLGLGASLMRHVERELASRGERVLLVETSGLPEFHHARALYDKLGYGREARIRDFYKAGEDKIVFRKPLLAVSG